MLFSQYQENSQEMKSHKISGEFQPSTTKFVLFNCLFVCVGDLPNKGTHKILTRRYKQPTGNSQSLSYKHCFNAYDYKIEQINIEILQGLMFSHF